MPSKDETFNDSMESYSLFASEVMDPEIKRDTFKQITQAFYKLFTYYDCAVDEIETKLNILNKEYSLNNEHNPIDSIKTRVKDLESIMEKARRKNIPFTVESLEKNIHDIAGVRVIVNFLEDVYKIRDGLLNQDDVFLIEEKDYIKNPKPNGYRSVHLIVETPIYLSTGKRMMIVEVQIRTIAQNFWASLEHQVYYKKDVENKDSIREELKKLASESESLDRRMNELRNKLNLVIDN